MPPLMLHHQCFLIAQKCVCVHLSQSSCEFATRTCQSIKIRGAVISSEEFALFRDTVIHYNGARAKSFNGVGGDIQKEHCLCILMTAFLRPYTIGDTLADLCMFGYAKISTSIKFWLDLF